MLPSLLVVAAAAAPGAPIPHNTLPNPTSPAPRVLVVRANSSGVVQISAIIFTKRKVQSQYVVIENGKQVVKQQEQEVTTTTFVAKNLEDFGGKFSTAEGIELTTEQALRRVKAGATVLVPADGKTIDPFWLRAVDSNTVVMHTDELVHAHLQFGQPTMPTTAPPRLVLLETNEKRQVRLAVNPNASNPGQCYDDMAAGFPNGPVPVRVIRGVGGRMVIVNGNVMTFDTDSEPVPGIRPVDSDGKKALADVFFDAYDLTGKRVARSEAIKQLKAGGLVLFAGDNRFPDPDYLKSFHEDMLVLVSPELIFAPGQPNPYDPPMKSAVEIARPVPIPRPAAPIQAAKQAK